MIKKSKINRKIKDKFVALGLEVPNQLRNMFEPRKVRPICKILGFVKYFSLCTSSKMLNLCKVYLAQFLTFLGFLGFFRNLKMSSKQPLWFHLHWIFHAHEHFFTKS